MDFIKKNAVTLLIAVALIASFVINLQQTREAELRGKINDVSSCLRANTRSALQAGFQRSLIRAGVADESPKLERILARHARGNMAYLAARITNIAPEEAIRTQKRTIDGKQVIILSNRSALLLEKGCAAAFGLPIEEIEEVPVIRYSPDTKFSGS